MIISQIVAASLNNVIGINNGLPWHMPADSAYFKTKTWGHHIITGRRNYEAEGKALPGRINIVLTKNINYRVPDAIVLHKIEDAINYAKQEGEQELFIVGGEEIYKLAMPFSDRIYLTRIHAQVAGDTYYPELNLAEWDEKSNIRHKKDKQNPYDYDYVVYERI